MFKPLWYFAMATLEDYYKPQLGAVAGVWREEADGRALATGSVWPVGGTE